MEIVGKLIKKEDIQSGVSKSGRDWQKLGFVLQVKGFKDKKKFIKFDTLNADMIQFMSDTTLESEVKVYYDIESREWQGKWFTNATAFKAEIIKDDRSMVTTQSDLNGMANNVVNELSQTKDSGEEGEDDLPFNNGESDQPLKNKEMLLSPREKYAVLAKNENFNNLVERLELEMV